jgi:NAD(P)-dependent dehydrogenase (short-subunit alcohol dehydrogenase family)
VSSKSTIIEGKTVLVTGANRGLGRALVEEALRRGVRRVYAGTRQPLIHADERVTPVELDVTVNTQIEAAVGLIGSLDILINNAGIARYDDLSDRVAIEKHLNVNLFGTYGVTQAFLPALTRSRGTIINVLSDSALAAMPIVSAYSISKAAALSMTRVLRAIVAERGVSVHAVLPGPIDTDMTRGYDAPKSSPESVAEAILDGVEAAEEDIFPDPLSQMLAGGWRTGAAAAQARERAALVTATGVQS